MVYSLTLCYNDERLKSYFKRSYEYALKKKVRWSMNSKQGARYIKRRMGNDLKQKILVQNGIISEQQVEKKPSILNCPRCSLVNAVDNKYCSKCSYSLVPSAFEEIKEAENRKMQEIQEKYEHHMRNMQEQINQIMLMVQQNPKLAQARSINQKEYNGTLK